MKFKNDSIILTSRFKSVFETAHLTIPVDYPGFTTEPLNGWIVRFRVSRAPSISPAIGSKSRRNYGSVIVQIVCPTGIGEGPILDVADDVSACFRMFRSGGLKCKEPSLIGPHEDAKSGLLTATVDIPFRSDYTLP